MFAQPPAYPSDRDPLAAPATRPTMRNPDSTVTIHMAASLDGFIARKDGGVDWMETADNFDDAIEERFSVVWKEAPELKDFDVSLDAKNGVATLEGKVATDSERTKAEGLVRAIPGVKDVVNSITVSPDARRTIRQ